MKRFGWIYTFDGGWEGPGMGANYCYRAEGNFTKSYIMLSPLAWRLMRPGLPFPKTKTQY